VPARTSVMTPPTWFVNALGVPPPLTRLTRMPRASISVRALPSQALLSGAVG
jgi:hypothetical protein